MQDEGAPITVRQIFGRAFLTAIMLIIAIPIFFAGLFGIREFQSRYIPVIVDFQVDRFERLSAEKIEFWGMMTKRFEYGDGLPMCRFAGMTWWIKTFDGRVVEATWTTLERPFNQTVNRQPGRQSFGPWILDYRGFPDAVSAYGVANHYCLGFWYTETLLGPITIADPYTIVRP